MAALIAGERNRGVLAHLPQNPNVQFHPGLPIHAGLEKEASVRLRQEETAMLGALKKIDST
ncbi:hypothetical protein [Arthrobacter sp. KNU40]|uniref:hypothetical protein n=1 Tax=Arthrobacter sp. KNU40 TaxID=3447965 RepID=UPI003F62AE2F